MLPIMTFIGNVDSCADSCAVPVANVFATDLTLMWSSFLSRSWVSTHVGLFHSPSPTNWQNWDMETRGRLVDNDAVTVLISSIQGARFYEIRISFREALLFKHSWKGLANMIPMC